MEERFEVGDWVMFYSGGSLVIDRVEVVKKEPGFILQLGTMHHGVMPACSVLETRKAWAVPSSEQTTGRTTTDD